MQAGIPVPRPQQASHPTGGVITPGPVMAAGQEAAQQPQLQKVRYTTNVPPGQRKTSAREILRNHSVDAVGPNSRAGAGLAAYHAQQAGQQLQTAPGQPQAPATIQPLQAPTQGQAGQSAPVLVGQSAAGEYVTPVTPQAVQAPQLAQPAGGYGIPPLTAMDLRR